MSHPDASSPNMLLAPSRPWALATSGKKALNGRGPIPSCSRQEARLHRPEAPSIDMCLLRRSRVAGHPPPLPRLRRRRIGFRCLSVSSAPVWAGIGVRHPLHPGRLGPPRHPGLVTPAPGRSGTAYRLLQSSRFSSTNHGATNHPTHHAKSRPSALNAGSPAPRSARPAKLSLGQGPPRARALTSTSPAIARWGALPRPDRLGHLMSRLRACAGRRSQTQVERERCPRRFARGRHTKASSVQGLQPQLLREEEREPRTRGAFHRQAAHLSRPVIHRLFPTCGITA